MRNLKKILALVLALVMSLSLMATAGAADFTDKADINADYQAAVDVLNGLKVFRGYNDGSFQPKGDITRAEVATIIYRIATADVEDAQAPIYTTWGKFDDVKDGAWYAGYVNYCANAGIVHGKTPAGVTPALFDPEARITGYQVLAMILRTIGYGKNGEFEGANWAINTAAQAKQLGIIDGVTENLLGSNATREFVAQILFKAILTSQVSYNALEGYKPTGVTLAKEKFGMERISGVVMANEYADLRDYSTMADGQTALQVDEKNTYILNVTTDLNDIGESRYAYVIPDGKRAYNLVVDELYDTGRNVTAETGDAVSWIPSFASSEAGVSVTGAEYFQNFDYATVGESEYRIEYQVAFDNTKTSDGLTSQEWFAEEYGVDPEKVIGIDSTNRLDDVKGDTYTRVIPMGKDITPKDIAIMKGIFAAAEDDVHTRIGVTGYVYAGTAKSPSKEEHDLSSEMTWRAFYDEYIVNKANTKFSATSNGTWLKVVDNDNDGVAEYVFRTDYVLDEVKGYNTRFDYFRFVGEYDDGTPIIDLDPDSYYWADVNYGDYEPAIGDVVIGALIDGKWQIELAPMETKTIQTVNFKAKTVTTTEDDTWNQSAIYNGTLYADQILEMNQKTEYEIFFDKFDHIRAYRPVKGTSDYALLSELYFTNQYNDKVIKNYTPIVEITIQDADTEEMPVSGVSAKNPSVFEGTKVDYTDSHKRVNTDYLQRAINHLGIPTSTWNDKDVSTNSSPTFNGDEFKYTDDENVSETNVAAYTLTDDGESVALASASAFKYDRQNSQLFYSDLDKDGNPVPLALQNQTKVNEAEYRARHKLAVKNSTLGTVDPDETTAFKALTPVYAVDYVQLDETAGVARGAVRYDIHEKDCSYNLYGTLVGDKKYDGNYVNATHNTQYYIVDIDGGKATGVSYFTDYANVPAIKASDISAIYAVASNTTADREARDYWVAEVIVIETKGIVQNYDSVALAYCNPEKTTGNVRMVEALDNMTEDPAIVLTPKKLTDWYVSGNAQWVGYGFYELYDTEVDEPDVESGKIVKINEDAPGYNAHGINAAVVARNARVLGEGNYIMIDRTGRKLDKYDETKLPVNDSVKVYGIYTRNASALYPIYELDDSLTVDDLKAGDQIIYVYNKNQTVLRYIVIANYAVNHLTSNEKARGWTNAAWLLTDYNEIIDEQNGAGSKMQKVSFQVELGAGETATIVMNGETHNFKKDGTVTLTIPEKQTSFDFEMTVKGGKLAQITPSDGWKLNGGKITLTASDDVNLEYTYQVLVVKASVYSAARVSGATADETTGVIRTVGAVEELIEAATEAAGKLTASSSDTDIKAVADMVDALEEVSKSLVKVVDATEGDAEGDGTAVEIEALADAIDSEKAGPAKDLAAIVGDVDKAKEDAVAMIDEAIEGFEDVEAVKNAADALKDAVDACVKADDVDDVMDDDNPLVKALMDALETAQADAIAAAFEKELKKQIKAAQDAVDKKCEGFAKVKTVKDAADALKAKIEACDKLEGAKPAQGEKPDASALDTYYAEEKLVETTDEYKDLVAALDAAAAGAALAVRDKAIEDATAAADDLVKAAVAEDKGVQDALTALKKAIAECKTVDEVEKIYKVENDEAKWAGDEHKALTDAIELAEGKAAAKNAAAKLVKDLDLEDAKNSDVKTAYEALVAEIDKAKDATDLAKIYDATKEGKEWATKGDDNEAAATKYDELMTAIAALEKA